MSGIGRCPLVLLAVPLPTGGNAFNVPRASHWGDYFVYSDVIKDWKIFSTRILLGVSHTATDQTTDDNNHVEKSCISIGNLAGLLQQNTIAVAIGSAAGNLRQQTAAIAVGTSAGVSDQKGIAIGNIAGSVNQGTDAVAIGNQAGQTNQRSYAVAIGYKAGQYNQQTNAIAIGNLAGQTNQQSYAIAVGYKAGQTNQSDYSIVIGQNVQPNNYKCIALGADSVTGIYPNRNGFYVRPVAGPKIGSNLLSWDSISKEIYYNSSSQRFKYDIKDYTDSKSVYQLEPREFKYKINGSPDIGMIAEEVSLQNKGFAYVDESNQPEGIQWNAITASLIQEMKEIKSRIQQLKVKKNIVT